MDPRSLCLVNQREAQSNGLRTNAGDLQAQAAAVPTRFAHLSHMSFDGFPLLKPVFVRNTTNIEKQQDLGEPLCSTCRCLQWPQFHNPKKHK